METLLAYVLRNGALTELDAAGWVIRLAKRVEALHRRGQPHGNVSAECILIERPSAKSNGRLADARGQTDHAAFQSPERLAGAGPSFADDTWALAVTLYLGLTGRLPFRVEEDGRVRQDERPERLWEFQEQGDVLQAILDRALEPDRDTRTRAVDELRGELERCFEAAGLAALPALEREPPAVAPKDDEANGPASAAPPPPAANELGASHAKERAEVVADCVAAPARGPGATRRRRRLVVAVAFPLLIAAAVLAMRLMPRAASPPPPSTVNTETAGPTATGAPSVPASPSPSPPADTNACMLPLFAENTFGHGVDVDWAFVCQETDPRAGAIRVIKEIVHAAASQLISDGMREWGMLGWHDMAAFAVLRKRCCPSPKPLVLPPSTGACRPLAKVLDELATAAESAARVDEPSLHDAAREYGRTVRCLVKNNGTQFFKRHTEPAESEAPAFQKTLARVVASKQKER